MPKTQEISIETYLFFRQETQFLRIVFKNNFLFHYCLTKLLISAIFAQEAVFHTYFGKKSLFLHPNPCVTLRNLLFLEFKLLIPIV